MALNYEVKKRVFGFDDKNGKVRGADENFGCGRF